MSRAHAAIGTVTTTVAAPVAPTTTVLVLPVEPARSVRWEAGIADTDGRRSSKRCCIFHAPRRFGESSSSSSDAGSSDEVVIEDFWVRPFLRLSLTCVHTLWLYICLWITRFLSVALFLRLALTCVHTCAKRKQYKIASYDWTILPTFRCEFDLRWRIQYVSIVAAIIRFPDIPTRLR